MKLFSAELLKSNETTSAKAVIIQRKGKTFSLLKYYTTDVENIQPLSKGLPVNIGISYFDTIEENITLPPVKDAATFRLISMNKLKESIDPAQDYLMAYKSNSAQLPDSSGGLNYKVLMVPSSLLYKDSGLTEDTMERLNMFTVSDFALCSLVQRYFPDKVVFHAYADKTKICVTICQNDFIIYTRSNPTENSANLLNAYYEYLNLTYMYATKNLRLKIDQVIFSGRLADMSDLVTMFYEFSGIAQSTLVPTGVIENCPNDVFQEYLIPISLCYLDDAYDMTPTPIAEKQAQIQLTSIVCIISFFIVMLLGVLNASSIIHFYNNKEQMTAQAMNLQNRIRSYMSEVNAGKERHFDLHYYRTLQERDKSALKDFGLFAELLKMTDFDLVSFNTKDAANDIVEFNGKLPFKRLDQMEDFKERLSAESEKITSQGGYTLENTTEYRTGEMIANIHLIFKRPKQGEAVTQ
ncbi:hypothetical protein [Seleniivibrio woodruffii]|uniref:Tfp pilus assembly PilM family ATPase n=1 Tax=Seleniivibrio woodruffii TaxID=1078050 RepID=A0A4R1K6K8_9BACT|nr:hypothetical protein [Seleniivibrio woodruffii]TCK59403.1 hypothetical protein C8D98_2337 [Seleniivibrio woodruffii]TVZ35556.1 hypothetical protein OF66_1171 [Seleniivibrio woodruffii]